MSPLSLLAGQQSRVTGGWRESEARKEDESRTRRPGRARRPRRAMIKTKTRKENHRLRLLLENLPDSLWDVDCPKLSFIVCHCKIIFVFSVSAKDFNVFLMFLNKFIVLWFKVETHIQPTEQQRSFAWQRSSLLGADSSKYLQAVLI